MARFGNCAIKMKISGGEKGIVPLWGVPKRLSEDDLRPILTVISVSWEPLSIDEIKARLHVVPPLRTLQRWLATLVERGEIESLGEGRGRRYGRPRFLLRDDGDVPEVGGEGIPLSPTARAIRKQIRRPESVRTPVGYNPRFLGDYRPNATAYLPRETRERLLQLGRTYDAPLPAGTHLRKVMDRLLIDLSWNSSRLEGNTYSLLETQRLLELGEGAAGHNADETQMLLNHKAAIELLAEQSEEIGFNRYTICSLHALLSDNLLPSPSAGGRLRAHGVCIGRSVFHPLEIPQLIEDRFEEMLSKAAEIEDAFEQSFFIMVHLPYLQPFEDVNKRVSRLGANIPLVTHNLSPLSFVDVPKEDYLQATLAVYELNRIEYLRDVFVWAYERSCTRYAAIRQSLGEPDPFRLRHRVALAQLVGDVIRAPMNQTAAVAFLRRRVPDLVPAEDRERLMELAETELASLHEGNFARFRIRPAEFRAWMAQWT